MDLRVRCFCIDYGHSLLFRCVGGYKSLRKLFLDGGLLQQLNLLGTVPLAVRVG